MYMIFQGINRSNQLNYVCIYLGLRLLCHLKFTVKLPNSYIKWPIVTSAALLVYVIWDMISGSHGFIGQSLLLLLVGLFSLHFGGKYLSRSDIAEAEIRRVKLRTILFIIEMFIIAHLISKFVQ